MNILKLTKAAAVIGVAAAVAACEPNLFEQAEKNGGLGGGEAEVTLDLSAMATGFSGDSISVSILALSETPLQSIRITASDALTADTTILTSLTAYQSTMRFGTDITDTLLIVRGVARTAAGQQATDSVRVRLF